jgi:polysaccharide biosynthesis/export protein
MGGNLPSARILTTIALLTLTGVVAAASQSKPRPDYRIGADDVLSISLIGQDPKYSVDVIVRPDGKITLPLVEEVPAADRTPLQLKQELTSAFGRYFEEPVVQVIPKEIRSLKVFIMGEVAKPGVYPLNDSMTILQLISLAGGLNPWADKRNIVLIGKEPLPSGEADKRVIDLKKVFDPRAKISIPELRPGDQVIVK